MISCHASDCTARDCCHNCVFVNSQTATWLAIYLSFDVVGCFVIDIRHISTSHIYPKFICFGPSVSSIQICTLVAVKLYCVLWNSCCINMDSKCRSSLRGLILICINPKLRVIFLAEAVPLIVSFLIIESRALSCSRRVCYFYVITGSQNR